MMLVKSSVATTQKRVHSPMDTGSTFSSSSTLFRITPLIRATRACEQTKKSYVHWDLLKIYKQWQCYRQIRLRTTRQLLCSRARALSHLCCTPVHSLASIFLDGTVRKCNGPTALLHMHARRTLWRGGGNFFFCIFRHSTRCAQVAGDICGQAHGAHFAANLDDCACFTSYALTHWGLVLANTIYRLRNCPPQPFFSPQQHCHCVTMK